MIIEVHQIRWEYTSFKTLKVEDFGIMHKECSSDTKHLLKIVCGTSLKRLIQSVGTLKLFIAGGFVFGFVLLHMNVGGNLILLFLECGFLDKTFCVFSTIRIIYVFLFIYLFIV